MSANQTTQLNHTRRNLIGITAVVFHLLEMFWMIGLAVFGLLRIGLSPRQFGSRANK